MLYLFKFNTLIMNRASVHIIIIQCAMCSAIVPTRNTFLSVVSNLNISQ